MKRVVVTGVGLVTPLGFNVKETWTGMIKAKSGIKILDTPEFKSLPCRIAGKIDSENYQEYILAQNIIKKVDLKSMSLSNSYSLVAAHEALHDANWFPQNDNDSYKSGCSIATGISGIAEIADAALTLSNNGKGYKGISPYFVTKILPNLSSGLISIKYKLKGPATSPTTACAAGAHAICDAYNFVKHGVVDVMVCGATEACVHPISIAGFSRMRALATKYNEDPEKASRPFDKDRDGFVMSEGAGCLVLESLDHAIARNANIYGEILSVASTSDANHITNPSSDGDGAYRCMVNALKSANLTPNDISYINSHATSTPAGDLAEFNAIKRLFSGNLTGHTVYISSFKGSLGHLLGAAGAVETVLTLLSFKNKTLIPTKNLTNLNVEFDSLSTPNLKLLQEGEQISLNETPRQLISLKNSFGFGGTNATICLTDHVK